MQRSQRKGTIKFFSSLSFYANYWIYSIIMFFIEALKDLQEAEKFMREASYPDETKKKKCLKMELRYGELYRLLRHYNIAIVHYQKGKYFI